MLVTLPVHAAVFELRNPHRRHLLVNVAFATERCKFKLEPGNGFTGAKKENAFIA